MKERTLMASFMAAGIADVVTTEVAQRMPQFGAHEALPFMGSVQMENGTMANAYLYRMLLAFFFVSAYALTRSRESNLKHAVDKVFPYANLAVWMIVAFNTYQIYDALR